MEISVYSEHVEDYQAGMEGIAIAGTAVGSTARNARSVNLESVVVERQRIENEVVEEYSSLPDFVLLDFVPMLNVDLHSV